MMIKMKIVKKENSLYSLKTENGKEYQLSLEILDFDEPNENDYLCMHAELLNPRYEGYSTFYTFGNLENKYGKENISLNDIDVIKIIKDSNEMFLKRLYG